MIGLSERSACSSFNRASIFATILVVASAMKTAEADSQWSNIQRQYLLSLDEKYIADSSCRKAVEDARQAENRNPSTSNSTNLPYSHCIGTRDPCGCYYREALELLR